MTPSPIRAENQRFMKPSPASNSATTPTAIAATITTVSSFGMIPWSMMRRSSSGFTTVMSASSDVPRRNSAMGQRYGRAYLAMRLTMPGWSFCLVMFGSLANPRMAT